MNQPNTITPLVQSSGYGLGVTITAYRVQRDGKPDSIGIAVDDNLRESTDIITGPYAGELTADNPVHFFRNANDDNGVLHSPENLIAASDGIAARNSTLRLKILNLACLQDEKRGADLTDNFLKCVATQIAVTFNRPKTFHNGWGMVTKAELINALRDYRDDAKIMISVQNNNTATPDCGRELYRWDKFRVTPLCGNDPQDAEHILIQALPQFGQHGGDNA